MKVLPLLALLPKLLLIKQPTFNGNLKRSCGSSATTVIKRATRERLAGKFMENQQIGEAANLGTETTAQFPLQMKRRQVHSAKNRWITS